jgi:hypothetical protein
MSRIPLPNPEQVRSHRVLQGGDVHAVVGVLMGVEAASLAVMSFLHLRGGLHGGSSPFRPSAAGIAEAIIGLALVAAVVTVWWAPHRARPIALGAVGFAIVGFVVGLNFTIRGGNATDIAYHATVLPVLVLTLVLLLRRQVHRSRSAESRHGR